MSLSDQHSRRLRERGPRGPGAVTEAAPTLERKLRRNRATLLTEAELDVLEAEGRRMIGLGYGALFADLGGSFRDQLRWSALGEKCRQVRTQRGLDVRAVALAAGMPQYRVQAIESGRFSEIVPALATRYFDFLGIESWVRRWARLNRELADRVGIPRQPRRSRHSGHEKGRAI